MSNAWFWAVLVAACLLAFYAAFISHGDSTIRAVIVIACILNVIAMLVRIFWPQFTYWPFNRKARRLTQGPKDE